jgi:ribosomal protein S18 acetylase RimI-like enzyme
MQTFDIRRTTVSDSEWIRDLLRDHWGSSRIVSRGRLYDADQLPGFVATHDRESIGLLTYFVDGTQCEVVTLDSLRENQGVGTALLKAVEAVARQAGCASLRLVTTNDNVKALQFYQKRGFTFVALHPNAVERSRTIKPEIPLRGIEGIPIRDELELELLL